jgi:hypothetical protein
MKHTLRCHDFGWQRMSGRILSRLVPHGRDQARQNRASPRGVAAIIAAGFVARLANTPGIGCTSLRAIDDSDSQRTRVSSCQAL